MTIPTNAIKATATVISRASPPGAAIVASMDTPANPMSPELGEKTAL